MSAARAGRTRPPARDGAPSISLIVPLYNEIACIDALLRQLRPLLDACEIVLVDGGSIDGTLERIDPAFRVLRTGKGRGRQLNAGARATSGDVLLFVHADSVLPPDPLGCVRACLRHRRAGCFGIRFSPSSPALLLCSVWSNVRASLRRTMFGDQGIFVERALFEEVGGFPDLPIMEDYRFSLELRARGVRPGLARRRIVTSSRRFPSTLRGQVRLMCQMADLRRRYRRGEDVEELARRYRDVR